MDDMNDVTSLVEGFRCYEQIKDVVEMNNFGL